MNDKTNKDWVPRNALWKPNYLVPIHSSVYMSKSIPCILNRKSCQDSLDISPFCIVLYTIHEIDIINQIQPNLMIPRILPHPFLLPNVSNTRLQIKTGIIYFSRSNELVKWSNVTSIVKPSRRVTSITQLCYTRQSNTFSKIHYFLPSIARDSF